MRAVKKRRAISDLSFWQRVWLLLGLLVVVVLVVGTLDPSPQDPNYHLFADQRSFLGISNFNDVVSNVGFAVFGFLGHTVSGHTLKHLTAAVATVFVLQMLLSTTARSVK